MAELPKISDETDLGIDQASAEYVELGKEFDRQDVPGGSCGWSQSVLTLLENRINYLRQTITDGYIELISDPEEKNND